MSKRPATRMEVLGVRRRIYHAGCGGDVIYDIDSMQYRCMACWSKSTYAGFWKFITVRNWDDAEVGRRFEVDPDDTLW